METIFGHDWVDIQRAQNGGKLHRTVDLTKPSGPGAPADEDHALLVKHGSIEALEAAGLYGVADRLKHAAQPQGTAL